MTRSILGKGKNASWERPDANTLTFEPGGTYSVVCNIEVEELNRASHITEKLAQSSEKIEKDIGTFFQPSRKLSCRAEEELMTSTSRGYRQIPLEPVDENEALEVAKTPPPAVLERVGEACTVHVRVMLVTPQAYSLRC